MTADQPRADRVAQLEAEIARLSGLLESAGVGTELRHQVRNTLSNIRAIMRRSALSAGTVEDYVAHLEGRFDVFLRLQNLLAWRSEGVDLHGLIAEELRVFAIVEGGHTRLSGPRIAIRPRAAEIFALAIHELAANAVKFGAIETDDGELAVTWRAPLQDGVPRLTLVWEERGAPRSGGFPGRPGFGREVLEHMLRYQLKARTALDFSSAGLRCEIRLPLSPDVGAVLNDEAGGS